MAERVLTFKRGCKDGFPVFLGYFTTALAFGLLTRTSGFTFIEGVLTSLTNFAGSGQFLMLNLYNAGSFLLEIVISVFLINSRYLFMSSSLRPHLEAKSFFALLFCGFGCTDEVFAISALKSRSLPFSYMAGLILTSYLGWVSGTATGFLAGSFLPPVVQSASVITIYAMFSSLMGAEVEKNIKALVVFFVSASLNTLFILCLRISTGLSFTLSMLISTIVSTFIYEDEEVLDE